MAAVKKENFEVPGTVVKCQSGMFLAFYEHRTDIVANGNNEREAKKNLKKMYKIIKDCEDKENEEENVKLKLPSSYKTKPFKEKLHSI